MLPFQGMHPSKHSRQDAARRAMREASELPQPSLVDIDPEDPSQLLDDAGQFSIVDLELDAEPHAEADADFDAAVATSAGEEGGREVDTPDQTTADAYAAAAEGTGELYGVHVPKTGADDLDVNRDRESFADSALGEHMFETLSKKMAENGTADPEQDIEFEDDSDPQAGHRKTDRRDRPLADKGSGGPGGL